MGVSRMGNGTVFLIFGSVYSIIIPGFTGDVRD